MNPRNFNQAITIWSLPANPQKDKDRRYSYNPPRVIKGKWVDENTVVFAGTNMEALSKAKVYLLENVLADEYLALGDHTNLADDPMTYPVAHRIMDVRTDPHLNNPDIKLVKALLE